MNFFSIKFKIVITAILFIVSPFMAFAQTGDQTCSANGYTIATINGIFTDKDGAIENRDKLKDFLDDNFNNEPITVDFLHNPSHLAGLGDIFKSIYQGLFDSETVEDYDLIEMIKTASEKVATQKLLLVAHSQGNFYANSFYDVVADKDGGIPSQSLAIYSVATPSSRVAGGGNWITSDTDKIIADLVARIQFTREILPPNIHIELQEGDSSSGHGFSDIYLKYQGGRIVSDIMSSLDRLKTNNIQDEQKLCLTPPKLSLIHRIEGGILAIADPLAESVFSVVQPSFIVENNISESIGKVFAIGIKTIASGANFLKDKVIDISQAIGKAFSQAFSRDNFELAQIIDISKDENQIGNQDQVIKDFSQNSDQAQEINPDQEGINQEDSQNQQSEVISCSYNNSQSPSHQKVIINEVAWMGGISGANDEWIELKNISSEAVDISGYQLIDQDEKIKIVFNSNSKIPAGGFYLLERADDSTVPEVVADVIYSGVLSNENESLRLFNSQCNLIDEVLAKSNWPAGDNAAKKTMERGSDFNWHTSSVIGGTPKKENSQPKLEQEENDPILNSTSTQISTSTSTSITNIDSSICNFNTNQSAQRQGIIINEVAWMGTTNSANDEWIEIKNISGVVIDLGNWQLLNEDEKIKIKFDSGLQIPASGFLLLERTDDDTVSGIKADKIYTGALSNTEEGLRLFDNQCNLIDEVFGNSGSDGKQWPAGNNPGKNTMERDDFGFGWHTSSVVNGTPKERNSSPLVSLNGGGGSPSNNQQQTNNVSQQSPEKILITEIQITGGPGKTEYDFIELYNPNNYQINLNGYRLVKRTKTGTDDTGIKSWTTDVFIPANSYYLWANSGYTDISVTPDVTTSAAVSDDNGVAIRFGAENTGTIIDGVGWGNAQNTFIEGQVFSANPGDNQSIQRKFQSGAYIDTGDNAQDFEIQNCPNPKSQSQTCQQPQAPTESAGANHIVISEIYPDKTSNNFDFVELYNPTDSVIDLDNHSLRIIKEEATSSDPLAVFTAGQIINARSFFLVGFDNYNQSTSTAADVFHSSYSLLSGKIATIILYNESDIVDEFNYDPDNLSDGQSFERRAFSANVCVSAENNGEFLGNGCDTDNAADFEIREIPNPQNSHNFPEPRNAPTAVQNLEASYSSSTMELAFDWTASQDYQGATSTLTYEIADISESGSTLVTVETSTTTARISINEISRDYKFLIQVFDKDGFGSATSTVSIAVPGFFSGLYFYEDPRSPSADSGENNYLIEAYYNEYPFIPDVYYGPPNSSWKLLVFYLNNEAEKQTIIDSGLYQPNNLENILPVKYRHCSSASITQSNSLLLPDISGKCDTSGGAYSNALDFSLLEDNHFIIQSGQAPSEGDYLTVAFYATQSLRPSDGRVPYFKLIAVDKTKYYFGDLPVYQPPQLTGQIDVNFERQNSQLHLSWPSATDSDTLDSVLGYEIQYASSTDWISVSNNVTKIAAPGDNFSITVKAKDDFGNYSTSTLAVSWSYPETTLFINQPIGGNWLDFGGIDGNYNIGVNLQSIYPTSTLQFNAVFLKVKKLNGNDAANLKLSVYNSGADSRPDFNSLINASVIINVSGSPEDNDLTFYFPEPITFNADNNYWLVLEVGGYPYAYNQNSAFSRNRWQVNASNSDPYPGGDVYQTTVQGPVYNPSVGAVSGSDWYMKIGMEN